MRPRAASARAPQRSIHAEPGMLAKRETSRLSARPRSAIPRPHLRFLRAPPPRKPLPAAAPRISASSADTAPSGHIVRRQWTATCSDNKDGSPPTRSSRGRHTDTRISSTLPAIPSVHSPFRACTLRPVDSPSDSGPVPAARLPPATDDGSAIRVACYSCSITKDLISAIWLQPSRS